MSIEPLVSVVLPTFNRAHSLPRAIRSVLGQSYRNLEVLVVDDCSTDDSEAVVNAIAATDPRVRFVKRERNGGAAAARNTGIQLARGELIAFQDSDDEWLVEKLQRQIDQLVGAGDNCALCVCGYLVHQPVEHVRGYYLGGVHMTYPDDLRRQALLNFYFPTPSWLARTMVLREAGGFDESLACWEDWELAIRISKRHEIVMIDEPLMVQHVSRGSVNRQDRAYGPALARMLEKHESLWASEPRALAEHLYIVGRHEARYGSAAQARRYFLRAARLVPGFRRAWRAWLATVFGSLGFRAAELWHRLTRREYRVTKSTVVDYVDRTQGSKLTTRKSAEP